MNKSYSPCITFKFRLHWIKISWKLSWQLFVEAYIWCNLLSLNIPAPGTLIIVTFVVSKEFLINPWKAMWHLLEYTKINNGNWFRRSMSLLIMRYTQSELLHLGGWMVHRSWDFSRLDQLFRAINSQALLYSTYRGTIL